MYQQKNNNMKKFFVQPASSPMFVRVFVPKKEKVDQTQLHETLCFFSPWNGPDCEDFYLDTLYVGYEMNKQFVGAIEARLDGFSWENVTEKYEKWCMGKY